ncbi:MAG: MYG1 family protein [bacterium]
MFWQRNKKKTVAVHDGHFHTDDVFAVAILSLALKGNIKVTRTRDIEVIRKSDYALDVGREYDPSRNRFDHHQPGVPVRSNGVPYAACGLVWKHFGDKIAGSSDAAKIIDEKIIQVVDAQDSAINTHNRIIDGLEPYLFIDYIFGLNPTWKEKNVTPYERFLVAVEKVKAMLVHEIKRAKDYLEGVEIVNKIYRETTDKRIIVLDDQYSWKKVLAEYPEPLFVVRPVFDSGVWYASAVQIKDQKFVNRANFPAAWGGKDGEEIKKITGVPDAVFCHAGLFMCSAKTKEGAIALAKLALEDKSL